MTRYATTALLAASLLAGAVHAQGAAPEAASAASPDRDRDWQAMHAEREARHEADIALLLDLDAGQTKLLHAFLASLRPPEQDRHRHGPDMMAGRRDALPGPADQSFGQRLATDQAALDQEMRAANARLAAARAFYAALDARQKQKWDAIGRLRHRPGHHPHSPAMPMRGPAFPGGAEDGPPRRP